MLLGAIPYELFTFGPFELIADPPVRLHSFGILSVVGYVVALGFIAIRSARARDRSVSLLDTAAFAAAFAWFFRRVGCTTIHDHPGAESEFFLAVSGWPDGSIRHDLGFYEALWCFLICAALLVLARRERPDGFLFAFVCLIYAPVRFLLEFLGVGPDLGGPERHLLLTAAQWVCLAMFVAGLYQSHLLRKRTPSGSE